MSTTSNVNRGIKEPKGNSKRPPEILELDEGFVHVYVVRKTRLAVTECHYQKTTYLQKQTFLHISRLERTFGYFPKFLWTDETKFGTT